MDPDKSVQLRKQPLSLSMCYASNILQVLIATDDALRSVAEAGSMAANWTLGKMRIAMEQYSGVGGVGRYRGKAPHDWKGESHSPLATRH
jgi:hypothetical protein